MLSNPKHVSEGPVLFTLTPNRRVLLRHSRDHTAGQIRFSGRKSAGPSSLLKASAISFFGEQRFG
jgi:hypothetical protein